MRTNIEIDDKLMKRAMRAAGTSTKRETVEKALETLIRIEGRRSIRSLRGKFIWEGDLDAMRRGE
jgi:Arc/MetJ family transcription regulator